MIATDVTTEVWRFDCPRCGESWTARYHKRHSTDSGGATVEYSSVDGTPVSSPLAPPLCQACGYFFVRPRLEPGD
jgi:hypothetical protein